MAEAILKEKLRRMQGSDVKVGSAGIYHFTTLPRDPMVVQILTEMGYPLPHRDPQMVTKEMMDEADIVVVMERGHIEMLTARYPEVSGKLRLLKTYSHEFDGAQVDIHDPYHQPLFRYRQCFAEIYLSIEGMMKCIFPTGD